VAARGYTFLPRHRYCLEVARRVAARPAESA
jgi:hypothetical protein